MPTPTRNFRLDPQTLALLAALAQHDGVSETDVIKTAVREAARRRKVRIPLRGPESSASAR